MRHCRDDVLPIYVQDTTHTRVAPNRLMLFNPVRLSRMIMTGLRCVC